jgi:hypothetical protein
MAKKRIEKVPRYPKDEEVDGLRDSLQVLKDEMERIDGYLRRNNIENDIEKGDTDRLKLRRQLVLDFNSYQESYAELTGLIAFYDKFNSRQNAPRKGFEPSGGGDAVFEELDRESILQH